MKKVFAFTLVMLLSSFIFIVPASAETIDTTADFLGYVICKSVGSSTNDRIGNQEATVSIPRQGDFSNVATTSFKGAYDVSAVHYIGCGLGEFTVTSPDSSGFYGDIGFYVSYYTVLNDWNEVPAGEWTYRNTVYDVTVTNGNNEVISTTSLEPVYFTPSDSQYPNGATSGGVHYSFTVNVPEETPVLKITIGMQGFIAYRWNSADGTGYDGPISFVIPSATLIADRTTAELEELRNITDAIIEQNKLTEEYYGEIISKVDDLYTEVGNLVDLQQEAIDQFDDWNIVSSVPGSVTDKTDQAEDVLDKLHQLEKPEPDKIVPELDTDTSEIAQILEPYFQNTLILQILMMTLGFGFVSYVLFGKKG